MQDIAVPTIQVSDHLGWWATQWDELVDLSPLPSPFLRSWWLTGISGPQSRFILAIDGDQLLGGLALEESRRLGLLRVRMAGAGPLCPDHLDMLTRPGNEDAVAQVVRSWMNRPGRCLMDMDGIRADSLLIDTLPGRVRVESLAEAPWARLTDDPDSYRSARPAGLRKTLRKAFSRFEAAGVSYRVSRGRSVAEALETLRQLHQAQWGDRSHFLPAFSRFARACLLGAEADEVAVHELRASETVLAIMVSFEVAGRVSLYQSARRTEYCWRDATTALLATITADACVRGFTEVDFLRGEEGYKSNFAPERRRLQRLWTARGWAGAAALAAREAARNVKRGAANRTSQ